MLLKMKYTPNCLRRSMRWQYGRLGGGARGLNAFLQNEPNFVVLAVDSVSWGVEKEGLRGPKAPRLSGRVGGGEA